MTNWAIYLKMYCVFCRSRSRRWWWVHQFADLLASCLFKLIAKGKWSFVDFVGVISTVLRFLCAYLTSLVFAELLQQMRITCWWNLHY